MMDQPKEQKHKSLATDTTFVFAFLADPMKPEADFQTVLLSSNWGINVIMIFKNKIIHYPAIMVTVRLKLEIKQNYKKVSLQF